MRERIDQALSSPQLRGKAARALLEVLRDAAAGDHAAREDARRALERREGKAIAEAAFAKRLERLNAALAKASPPLRIVSERGELRIDDGTPAAAEGIAAKNADVALTAHAPVPSLAVRARALELNVFFSYAHQEAALQRIQREFMERVQERLRNPPARFKHLPPIRIWRDESEIERSIPLDDQVDAVCQKSFLALVVVSRRYPSRPGCMREFDWFVDAEGKLKPGKQVVVVPLDCAEGALKEDFPERFWRNLGLWTFDEGKNLLQHANRRAPAKIAFAHRVATEIWLAAERSQGSTGGPPGLGLRESALAEGAAPLIAAAPLAKPGSVEPPPCGSLDDIAEALAERRLQHSDMRFTRADATQANMGADVRKGARSEPPPYESLDDIAEALTERRLQHSDMRFTRSGAKRGSMGADVREGARPEPPEGAVDIVAYLAEWAERRVGPREIALLGDFGMGKTVACQVLTQTLTERWKGDHANWAPPVYLDMREIRDPGAAADADLEPLVGDMLRGVGRAPLDPRQVIAYARERGALVIFDGIDEVANKLPIDKARSLYRNILRIAPSEDWIADREARKALYASPVLASGEKSVEAGAAAAAPPPSSSDREPSAKRGPGRPKAEPTPAPRKGPLLLVTCRTHYFAELAGQSGFLLDQHRAGLEADADVETWYMLPFDKQRIDSYLKQNLGEADGARALAMIEATYNLEELATRPILLKFFADAFRSLEQQKLEGGTIDIGKLYEAFVDQTLARDEPKHVIPIREKKLLLAELALHLYVEGLNAIANDDLDAWLTREIEAEPALRKLQWGAGGDSALSRFELFLQDLRNATLLVRPGEKEFRFGHASVREFFLAEALHRHVREGRLAGLGAATVTAETVDFLLARQRNGAPREAARFGEEVARLVAPGKPLDLRRFAADAIFRAGGDLAWPPVADFSDFDFTGAHFVAPGGGARDARPVPPAAIWRGARLHDATFEGLALRGDDFRGADASSSLWVDCDFSGAATAGLDLSAAELRHCRADTPLDATDLFAESLEGVGALAGWRARAPLARREAAHDRWATPSGPVAALSLDGRAALASGSYDGTIRVWDVATGKTVRSLEGHPAGVMTLAALSLDGRAALASGSGDTTIRVWDLATGNTVRRLEGHSGAVMSLAALSLDGRAALASGAEDGTIRVWDLTAESTVRRLAGHSGRVRSPAALSLDGRAALVSGSGDGTIRVWDLATGKIVRRLAGQSARVMSLTALSLDGRAALASGSLDGTIRVLDLATGKIVRRVEGHFRWVTRLATVSLDGRAALAAGSGDGTIRVLDLATGKSVRRLEGRSGQVWSLAALSLDGRAALAAGSSDGTIRVWDAATGKRLRVLEGHSDSVTSVAALSLGGRAALAAGSVDGTIRVWDLATGDELTQLDLGLGAVHFANGSEPGSLIACSRLVATIDAASVAALVAKRGIVRMRRLALDPDYQGSFVDTERDAATGELLKATVGPEAWRDFIAVGADADGRQSVRPIEDLAT